MTEALARLQAGQRTSQELDECRMRGIPLCGRCAAACSLPSGAARPGPRTLAWN